MATKKKKPPFFFCLLLQVAFAPLNKVTVVIHKSERESTLVEWFIT